MEFTVPQFIERAPRIVGPLTFKQFVFIGIAGGICLFLYFTVSFVTFIIAAIFIMGGALALAFFKIEKTALPIVIKNFFFFLFKSKIYLWKRGFSMKVIKKIEKVEEIEKEETILTVTRHSHLRALITRLETKSRGIPEPKE